MGLSTPPATGYQDYQRNEQFDGPLAVALTGNINAPTAYGPFSVGAYWGVNVRLQARGGDARVVFTWFQDSAATILIGSIEVDAALAAAAYQPLILSNVGPYLTVTVRSPEATYPIDPLLYVAFTNRVNAETTPNPPDLLVDQQPVNIPTGTTQTLYPMQAYAGDIQFWMFTGAACQVTYQVWTGVSWDDFAQYNFAAGADPIESLLVPVSSWRLGIANSSGATAGFFVAIVADINGS